MTTTVTGLLCWRDSHPLERQLASLHQTVDNDHGRLEIRRHWSTSDIDWLKESHPDWTDLTSIGLIERETERAGKVEITLHPYIASTPADAVLLAAAARSHWGIENDLHWSLDVTFHEDLSRLRSAHGPHNMAVVRHIAFNLLKQAKAKGKDSLKTTRKKAAWSTDFCNPSSREPANMRAFERFP